MKAEQTSGSQIAAEWLEKHSSRQWTMTILQELNLEFATLGCLKGAGPHLNALMRLAYFSTPPQNGRERAIRDAIRKAAKPLKTQKGRKATIS
jgi:hypothetical protein